jgi:hypothetical protein
LAVNSLIVNPNGAMLRFTIQPFTGNLRLFQAQPHREPQRCNVAVHDTAVHRQPTIGFRRSLIVNPNGAMLRGLIVNPNGASESVAPRMVEIGGGVGFVDDIGPMQNLVVGYNLGRSPIRRDRVILGKDQHPRGDFTD